MDIRDVGADLNRASRSERKGEARVGTSDNKKSEGASKQDFFENSGKLGQVRALIDSLVQVPELRSESIERARALLDSGELDSPERAAEAAEGLFAETQGFTD